jgi:hypothetical protein
MSSCCLGRIPLPLELDLFRIEPFGPGNAAFLHFDIGGSSIVTLVCPAFS